MDPQTRSSRRDIVRMIGGAAVAAALPAQAVQAETRTEFEELVEIRDRIVTYRDRSHSSDLYRQTAKCAISTMDMAIMAFCPHRSEWIAGRRDSINPEYRHFYCPHCRTWGSHPALDSKKGGNA